MHLSKKDNRNLKAINPLNLKPIMKKILLTSFLSFIFFSLTFAQGEINKNAIKADAAIYYKEGRYNRAMPLYKDLVDLYPNDLDYKEKLGNCYLELPGKGYLAIELYETILKNAPKTSDIHFKLGNAYMADNRFDNAIEQFNMAIEKSDKDADYINRLITNCENGKILTNNPIEVEIENLGAPVNTKFAEYSPLISSDESVIIFTYLGEGCTGGMQDAFFNPSPTGEYFEDVFISHKINNVWETPASLSINVNSNGHEASIALASDGQTLFMYKNDKGQQGHNGQIYVTYLEGDRWSRPEPLNENINSKYWEGSASLSANKNILYFASDRPGGFGGRDLYYSEKDASGNWGEAKNLGNNINTAYDEDAPFIHPDSRLLYFSSKGHNSMGGYDIFVSKSLNEKWTNPKNVGYPINTIEDDIYYVVSASGEHAYFSSGRKGSIGELDIYTATPGITDTISLIMVKGIVSIDNQPVEAKIEVIDNSTNEQISEHTSNAITGKYLINLEAGKDYKLRFKKDEKELKEENINTTDLTEFKTLEINIPERKEEVVEENTTDIKPDTNDIQTDNSTDTPPEEEMTYDDILARYGDEYFNAINYTIQIGAYKNAQRFAPPKLEIGDEKVVSVKGQDGVTRFRIGSYNNLNAAEVDRKKCINKGVSDAFIIGIYQNKAYYLDELVKNNFFLTE